MVPGHEIVGRVTAVGGAVKKFKVGDPAAVGVIVDSDRVCENCVAGEEQYCIKGAVETYNKLDYSGKPTYGGDLNNIVAGERVLHAVFPKLNPGAGAPLLFAGITNYSPLPHLKVGEGSKVGGVGVGGLG